MCCSSDLCKGESSAGLPIEVDYLNDGSSLVPKGSSCKGFGFTETEHSKCVVLGEGPGNTTFCALLCKVNGLD